MALPTKTEKPIVKQSATGPGMQSKSPLAPKAKAGIKPNFNKQIAGSTSGMDSKMAAPKTAISKPKGLMPMERNNSFKPPLAKRKASFMK